MAIGEILTAFCFLFHLTHGSEIELRADPVDLCNGRHGIFIKNDRGCELFYYCNHGQALEGFCPGDFWFNEDSGICEERKNVLCTTKSPVKPPEPDVFNESIMCPVVDTFSITFIASKIDCNRYYICYHGYPIRQQCIKDMHWNEKTNQCDYPDNAKCELKPSWPICPLKGQVFYPHPEMCDYFIYCQNGYLTVQQCPFYFHWDTVTQSCRWRNLARCSSKAFLV